MATTATDKCVATVLAWSDSTDAALQVLVDAASVLVGSPGCALCALKISKLSAPGRYADGNCLYLVVDRSGAKRWVLRVVVQGRRRDMGLGGVKIVSLAHARDAARWYRAIARSGGDPFNVRRHEGRDPRSTLVKELGLMRFLYTLQQSQPARASRKAGAECPMRIENS